MATPISEAVPVARNEPLTRTALLLKAIALRHQIAVLERSRTRRSYFRRIDRLFWIVLSCWWPSWRENLMIVQPESLSLEGLRQMDRSVTLPDTFVPHRISPLT